MDQESRQLAWWAEAVFHDWRQRPGPRYAKLAAAILEAIDRKTLREGTRIPAERVLAAAVGVSRGTVVASFDHLVTAGVLVRRQGDGTYVTGRPSWTATTTGVTTALLRRIAADREVIDMAVASPGDLSHLPSIDLNEAWLSLAGHGLDPSGLPQLRQQVARHLTENQGLPTSPDQLVITSGAQEALWLLTRTLPARTILASCPTDPGLLSVAGGGVAGGGVAGGGVAGAGVAGAGVAGGSAVGSSRATITAVPGDAAGLDPGAIERAGKAPRAVAFVMPTGHDPTGAVMPAVRRQSIAAIADAGRVTIIENLSFADLTLGAGHVPTSLAALSPRVIAVGSASKLLWGGLRVGWIRVCDESLRTALIGRKVALNLAASAISQAITAQLLAAITPGWLSAHRAALTHRRDHLLALLAALLPAWRVHPPEAGLSVWVELPVSSADAFMHAAARYGVTLTPGAMACVDGKHLGFVRLSFALELGTLELAAERLAAAWAAHAEDLAVAPRSLATRTPAPESSTRPIFVGGLVGGG
jgi:DNA-binding transcriptional MocR family regulator